MPVPVTAEAVTIFQLELQKALIEELLNAKVLNSAQLKTIADETLKNIQTRQHDPNHSQIAEALARQTFANPPW